MFAFRIGRHAKEGGDLVGDRLWKSPIPKERVQLVFREGTRCRCPIRAHFSWSPQEPHDPSCGKRREHQADCGLEWPRNVGGSRKICPQSGPTSPSHSICSRNGKVSLKGRLIQERRDLAAVVVGFGQRLARVAYISALRPSETNSQLNCDAEAQHRARKSQLPIHQIQIQKTIAQKRLSKPYYC